MQMTALGKLLNLGGKSLLHIAGLDSSCTKIHRLLGPNYAF